MDRVINTSLAVSPCVGLAVCLTSDAGKGNPNCVASCCCPCCNGNCCCPANCCGCCGSSSSGDCCSGGCLALPPGSGNKVSILATASLSAGFIAGYSYFGPHSSAASYCYKDDTGLELRLSTILNATNYRVSYNNKIYSGRFSEYPATVESLGAFLKNGTSMYKRLEEAEKWVLLNHSLCEDNNNLQT